VNETCNCTIFAYRLTPFPLSIYDGEGEEKEKMRLPLSPQVEREGLRSNAIALRFLSDNATLTLSPVEG
jgi:hypothetical protein